MNKLDKFLSIYIVGALPFLIGLIIWGSIVGAEELSHSTGITRIINDGLGWVLMTWIPASLFMVLKMVIVKKFRETLLLKISGITERDERESIISGEAAKFSFLSTAAVLLLFLFLSIFTITIVKYPEEVKGPDKNGYISIGIQLNSLTTDTTHKEVKEDGIEIFNYNGFPLSNSLLILLILAWQFGSYRYLMHKEL